MAINFSYQFPIKIRNKRSLKSIIRKIIVKEEKTILNIDVIFCDDAYLLNINKEFLNHNYYTDIITFDLKTNSDLIAGELYISIETVQSNAKDRGIDFNVELHRVIFHGILHLCGYNDKTKKEKVQIRHKEDEYLSQYLSLPLSELANMHL